MIGAGDRTSSFAALIGLASLIATVTGPACAKDAFPIPTTTFGTVGLVEMPSARMAPDGQLSLSASFLKNIQRYNFGFQALPWLDVSFRYSGILHYNISYNTYFDRSYGIKIRLFDEGEYRPAIAIGSNDFIGTGVYGGEYVVASKRVFDDFDATVGMGWGRLASVSTLPNPFGYLLHSFKTRPGINGTGRIDLGQLFHGPRVGLFGGVVWRTPVNGLSLIAEYSSDSYVNETASGSFRPKNQVDFGVNYQLLDSVQIGLDWLYGESVGLTVSLGADPKKALYPARIAPEPIEPAIRTPDTQMAALEALGQEQDRWKAVHAPLQPSARRSPTLTFAVDRFVDGVMERDAKVRDVEFLGTTLRISISSRGDTVNGCGRYAQLAANYMRNVEKVVVSAPRQQDLVCAVAPLENTGDGRTLSGYDLGPQVIPAIASFINTEPPPSPDVTNTSPQLDSVKARIRHDADDQSVQIEALALSRTAATVYFQNYHYGSDAEAVARLTRVLMRDAPSDVEYFYLISVHDAVPVQEFQVLRTAMERALSQHGGPTEIRQAITIRLPELDTHVLDDARVGTYPKFNWAIYPEVRESFFDPDLPVRFAVLGGLSGGIEIARGLSIDTTLEANIWNNFASRRTSNSVLPHVRSDFAEYYRHGVNGIDSLQASYQMRLTPSVFGIVKVGYLESMFAGAGGEVLWKPENSRLAVGVDLYEAWQRNFDRLFGLQQYHVLTGHVTLYYDSPWYGLNFRVHAGRYLAGDHGVTFEMTRKFSTGVEIGAFATFTNVPFSKFGEGSFDKGIIIRIPLDWALPVSTQAMYGLDLRPLTRDGGQRLAGDVTLYDDLSRSSYGSFLAHSEQIAQP